MSKQSTSDTEMQIFTVQGWREERIAAELL